MTTIITTLSCALLILSLTGAAGHDHKRVYTHPDPDAGLAGPNNGLHHVVIWGIPFDGIIDDAWKVCGGSLISQQWVLTAAHCDAWRLYMILNSHPDNNLERKYFIETKRIFRDRNQRSHDLMLLKVGNLAPGYDPPNGPFPVIRLPAPGGRTCRTPPMGDHVDVYGRMIAANPLGPSGEMESVFTNELRTAELDVAPCVDIPIDLFRVDARYRREHVLCASRHNVGLPRGDSGGSLLWADPQHQPNRRLLHGVYSVTIAILNPVPAYPDVFMDICNDAYRKWIQRESGV